MRISIKEQVLIIHFLGDRELMNNTLDSISNLYEGTIVRREGHNFPSKFIPDKHDLGKYKNKCQYVVGVYKTSDLKHELLHAKFYIDKSYRKSIEDEWQDIPEKKRKYLVDFLKRLGYSDDVLIDEYQAYRYSEQPNFFGIRL